MTDHALPVIPRRSEVARAHRRAGGRVAAVLPIHYPRALLRAFDILSIEVWGPPGVDTGRGMTHLQPYVCSIVRNALAFLENGGLDVADLLLVPHACDSLQGLGSLLLDFVRPRHLVLPFYLPRADGAQGREFLSEELRALRGRLEQETGRSPSDGDLLEAVRREEAADGCLARLHAERESLALDEVEFYRLVRAREFLPLEDFTRLANAGLALRRREGRPGIPLILSGIVPEPMDVLRAIGDLGGRVVADDLAACGRRLYPPGGSEEPCARLAESLLAGPPDSTRGASVEDRLRHLRALAGRTGAAGVVFLGVKFCEPELFYLPQLRDGLLQAGLRSLVLEVDLNDPLSRQTLTRLEAFLEMMA